MPRRPFLLHPLLAALSTLASFPAAALEGLIEINQTSIDAAGGFPLTLGSGSYRLTGDLSVPDLDTTALRIAADLVTVDLAGHAIRGPNACEGGRCGTGSGIGIEALPGATGTTILHGTVAGMGADGLRLGDHAHVEGLLVSGCGGDGIRVGTHGVVLANRAWSNGDDGIELGDHSLARDNVATAANQAGTGGLALRNARGGEANVCDDRSCGSGAERHFYLSKTPVNGQSALQQCAAGFHMASLGELFDPSGLRYDALRGHALGDGTPPTSSAAAGWIRTGYTAYANSGEPGKSNCDAWTAGAGIAGGTVAYLNEVWTQTGTTPPVTPPLWPWKLASQLCTFPSRVWCVQD
ncbi:MAG: right-handed parallel beta-helix repeat-containing protein [Myxococcota bacterium]